MSSIRNPARKKQLAYERDHYTKGNHNDKRFRKAWPKIKRRMVRAGRHIAEEVVRQAGKDEEVILPLRPKKKHKLHKRNSATLQRVVDRKLARRSRSVGAKKRRKANWHALVVSASLEMARQERERAARLASKKKRKKSPNQALEPTTLAVTSRAPSSTRRDSQSRGSS